jgi:hypothetical protein
MIIKLKYSEEIDCRDFFTELLAKILFTERKVFDSHVLDLRGLFHQSTFTVNLYIL